MDRYFLFTFYVGHPSGGAGDLVDAFPTVEEALENLLPEPRRWFQVFDTVTRQVVREGLAMYKDFAPENFGRAE